MSNIDSAVIARFIRDIPAAFAEGDDHVARKSVEARNVELIREAYQAVARGDLTGYFNTLHDDVVLETLGMLCPEMCGRWQGRQQVAAAMGRNFALIETQTPLVECLIAQGEMVVICVEERGRLLPDHRDYHLHVVQLFTVREGKIVRIRQLVAEALPAADAPQTWVRM